MQQKLAPSVCSVSNLCFQVMHKGKKVKPFNSPQKTQQNTFKIRYKKSSGCIEGFIPTNLVKSRKQIQMNLKLFRKQVQPLKPVDVQHRGFPVRKIRTSMSCRNISNKKQKNFVMGQTQTPFFTNPLLNQLVKTQMKQKSFLPQYMSKSALQNYTSNRITKSARMRRSII